MARVPIISCIPGRDQCWPTPHVVMTGSLKTLQQSWQHSFTDGCSANTWGSYTHTHTVGTFLCQMNKTVPQHQCTCVYLLIQNIYFRNDTVSSSSSCSEKVERREMLDSEWRDRTEMAESDLRGVPMRGWGDGRRRQRKKICFFFITMNA